MKYEEFQHLARLYVLGSLDPDEMEQFRAGRALFGPKGEAYIDHCRKLAVALALSLKPVAPHPDTKKKLMDQIRASKKETPLPEPAVSFPEAFVQGGGDRGKRRC